MSRIPPVPARDGVAVKVLGLLGGLSQLAEVDLVAYTPQPSDGSRAAIQEALPGLAACHLVPRGPEPPSGPGRWLLAASPARLGMHRFPPRALPTDVGSRAYECVHLDGFALLHLSLLRKPPGVLVWSLNDAYSRTLVHRRRNTRNPVQAAAFTALRGAVRRRERAGGREADFVDVVAPSDRDYLVALGVHNARLLPLGRRVEAQVSRRPGPPTAGVIAPLKGPRAESLRRFVSGAWPAVLARLPEARLHVVGRSADADDELMALLAADPSIEHRERVPEVTDFLATVDVSLVLSQARQGVPNKALEALGAGVPVVGLAQLGNLPPSDAFVQCADEAEMARVLADVLADEARRHAMRRAAQRLMAEWPTWDDVAARYLDDVDRVLASRPPMPRP